MAVSSANLMIILLSDVDTQSCVQGVQQGTRHADLKGCIMGTQVVRLPVVCWLGSCGPTYTERSSVQQLSDQPGGDYGVESWAVVHKQHSHMVPHPSVHVGKCLFAAWRLWRRLVSLLHDLLPVHPLLLLSSSWATRSCSILSQSDAEKLLHAFVTSRLD